VRFSKAAWEDFVTRTPVGRSIDRNEVLLERDSRLRKLDIDVILEAGVKPQDSAP
jgi:hypothetical protein